MQVYIMRHGQAFTSGSSDALRGLTVQGKLEAHVMAKWLDSEKISIDQIIVSPFIRAQETTKELISYLGDDILVTTLDFITPSGSAEQMHDYIDGVCVTDKIKTLLIVSHMPLVSYLVAELTVDGNGPIFQTAGIAHIDYDTKRMKGHMVSLTSPNELC
ncbi:phosphohistidine phosphatase SixA [Colwellia sp. RE-S-Sl-9]